MALDHGLLLCSRRQNGGLFSDWLLIAPPLNIEGDIEGALAETILSRLTIVVGRAQNALLSGA